MASPDITILSYLYLIETEPSDILQDYSSKKATYSIVLTTTNSCEPIIEVQYGLLHEMFGVETILKKAVNRS